MLSNEDRKDVSRAFGAKAASKVSRATNDAKSKALDRKSGKKTSGRSGVVLGMYDRDFSKPFDQKDYNRVARQYRKDTGKELDN